MRTNNNTRGDTGKRFSEQLKRDVAIAISMGKITLAEARKLHDIKGGNTLKGWINKYAGGQYIPGKRGRKSASEKNGLQFSEGVVSMIPAMAVSNSELTKVLIRREAELNNELQRIRRFQALVAKAEPKVSNGRKSSLDARAILSNGKAGKKYSVKMEKAVLAKRGRPLTNGATRSLSTKIVGKAGTKKRGSRA